jgi:N-acetylglucosaminyldiphosphoundecaprenol N-acetyl-beta-D-mannosaminyltransferase
MNDAVSWLTRRASDRSHGAGVAVRFANAWCVVLANESRDYATLMATKGVNFPDGFPVARIIRRTDSRARRVRGPSFLVRALDAGRAHGVRHYFLGATEDTLTALAEEAQTRFPGIEIAGFWSPPFGPFDDETLEASVSRIRRARPDVVWVGLGSPKQDHAAQKLAEATGLPCCGVGAAFDFVAGTVREAPRWIQFVGLEWLYRLTTEPRRLWRRYVFGNARFLWYVATQGRTGSEALVGTRGVDQRNPGHSGANHPVDRRLLRIRRSRQDEST